MKQFTYLLLLLSPFFAFTQKRLDLVHENAFAFYDYQEKAFCVLDDSTFLWKYDAKKEKWEKSPIELQLEMPFERFLSDFIVMSEKGSPVYFVYAGCGVVYVKNGGTIQRHDHSFYHMNQFSGAFFMDQGEPRIYGGYGLFTTKNIITRYDTTKREWFVINTNNNPPPTGFKNIIQKYKNRYYLFDGYVRKGAQLYSLKTVWSLDLKSFKWIKLGVLNDKVQGMMVEALFKSFVVNNKTYLCFSDKIIMFDFDEFRFRKFNLVSNNSIRNIIQVNNLFLLTKTESQPNIFVEISDSNFLNDYVDEEGDILKSEVMNSNNTTIIFYCCCISFLVITLLMLYNSRKKRLHSNIVKSIENTKVSFEEFNQIELELIQLLLTHRESGLEISHINDLVNHDQPSIDTLKKRREILLKDLRYKLASKFNIGQDEVFIERRMENDKRMKLLFLNELVKI